VRRTCAIWLFVSLSLLASCSSKSALTSNGGNSGSPGAATLTGVSVSPNVASVSVSSTVAFKAMGSYSDGTTQDLTSTAQWSSSDSSIAGVTAPGVAMGMASGSTTISAQSGGFSGSANLTVNGSGGSGAGSGGSGAAGAANVNLTSITITPASPSIPINTIAQLTATGNYSDGSTADLTSIVTWSSSSLPTATVNSTGAVSGVAVGTSTITAVLNTTSASVTVAVTAPSIVAISVSPDDSTEPLDITQQFTATALYSDGSSQDLTVGVTWSSSSTSVATIDNTGLAATVGAGTTTITATVGSQSDTATLTVVAANLTSIVVAPATSSMAVDTQQPFTATGIFDDGSTQLLPTVQWSSSDQNVLTIDANGLGTAVNAGTSTVTATSGSISGTASVTVTSATLVSIAIAPLNSNMPVNAAKQFSATGTFSDSSTLDMTQQVLWKSSSPSVATISAAGLASSVATGSTTIQAAWGSITQSTTLTVSNVKLVSIAITPANPTIAKRTSLKLSVTGTYSDGSTGVVTGVSWKSSKPQIANMRGSGIIHAKKAGTATITATAFGLKATTTLTVSSGTLVSVVITPANTSVSASSTQQFTATGTFSDGTTQDVTLNAHWRSSVASVATIANAPSVAGLATTYASGVTTIGMNTHGITATTSLIVN
jgi:uncharacterized protein YjdB